MIQQRATIGVKRSPERDDEQILPKRPRLIENTPCLSRGKSGQQASFTSLPDQLYDVLYQYIPSEMALSSKLVGKQVLNYLVSDVYAERVANLLDDPDLDVEQTCQSVGVAIKRATFLFPVVIRLQWFHKFNDKLHSHLKDLSQSGNQPSLNALKCTGDILYHFTCGWDDEECLRVFKSFSCHYSLSAAMAQFTRDEPGRDAENEMHIRRHLRLLFLDSCQTNEERAQWISFIAYHLSNSQLAKLLLLLYGPLNEEGSIKWTFALEVRAFERYTADFNRLGRIVSILRLIPNWTTHKSLEVLVYMSNMPNCWLLRSFAALLLPLNQFDKDVVFEYFSVLYKSDRTSTASLIMALVLMISPHFIRVSDQLLDMNVNVDQDDDEDDDQLNFVFLDSRSACGFIYGILNHPILGDQRLLIINKFWDTVCELAKDFASAAINEDDFERSEDAAQDYRALIEAWGEYMSFLLNDREENS